MVQKNCHHCQGAIAKSSLVSFSSPGNETRHYHAHHAQHHVMRVSEPVKHGSGTKRFLDWLATTNRWYTVDRDNLTAETGDGLLRFWFEPDGVYYTSVEATGPDLADFRSAIKLDVDLDKLVSKEKDMNRVLDVLGQAVGG